MNAPLSIEQVRRGPSELANIPDQAVDMFTERGFKLANRIAQAFASSDAVPAAFRSANLKKSRDGDAWVENPSAIGNCLVAIETARACSMSITSVMQNANVIEGRLSWSAQFVIAAVNASGRFHPLRFDMKSRGPIKAKYKEKQGWNKAKGGYDFVEHTVDVEDHVCVAWTLPRSIQWPANIFTLDQAKAANLPVIESSPVSMKLAVEEGWYGKSGSKWQTEMKYLMLQYRSGTFFGRIHAPDIVMGMGQTAEEVRDAQVLDMAPDGTYTVTTESLRADMARVDQTTGEITHDPSPTIQPQAKPQPAETVDNKPEPTARTTQRQQVAEPAEPVKAQSNSQQAFDLDAYANKLDACSDFDTLDMMADEVSGMARDGVISEDATQTLLDIYRRRKQVLHDQAGQRSLMPEAQAQQAQQTTTRRRSSASTGQAPE